MNAIEASADITDAVNIASSVHGVAAKTTPVDNDEVGLIDSAASWVLKKLTWANIKATLKTYFDTLYTNALHITTVNATTYTLLVADIASSINILNVTYTDTGTVAITLPTALITGGEWTLLIKDADFNAGTNNITIQTEGAETIDESATYVINYNGGAINIYCDSSNLFAY